MFYAPQAYTAIPGQFRFPPAKAHVGGRGLIRTPSVRGEDGQTLCDARGAHIHKQSTVRFFCPSDDAFLSDYKLFS